LGTRQSDGQGFRDLAVVLPIVAVLLLTPPLIRIFATPATLGGIPVIVVYIFAVWASVILVAAMIARHTRQTPGGNPEDSSDPAGRR